MVPRWKSTTAQLKSILSYPDTSCAFGPEDFSIGHGTVFAARKEVQDDGDGRVEIGTMTAASFNLVERSRRDGIYTMSSILPRTVLPNVWILSGDRLKHPSSQIRGLQRESSQPTHSEGRGLRGKPILARNDRKRRPDPPQPHPRSRKSTVSNRLRYRGHSLKPIPMIN